MQQYKTNITPSVLTKHELYSLAHFFRDNVFFNFAHFLVDNQSKKESNQWFEITLLSKNY